MPARRRRNHESSRRPRRHLSLRVEALEPRILLAPDIFEPNNTPATATPIIVNGPALNLSIDPAGDDDWATFTLGVAADVTIATNGPGTDDTTMSLYGPDDPSLFIDYDDDGGPNLWSLITASLTPGTYYVEVQEFGDNGVILNYTLSVTALLPDAYEPDDTAPQASVIPSDGTLQYHSFHVGNDIDWAQFTIAEPGNVTITTAGPAGDTEMWFYGPDDPNVLIDYNNDYGTTTFSQISAYLATPGTYYVQVGEFGADSTLDQYTLRVLFVPGDTYEPDDTSPQASTITTDGTPQLHSLHTGTDVDWARFNLSTPGVVIIETDGPAGDTVLWLFGPNDPTNLIASDDNSGNGAFSRIEANLGPGLYYVAVTEYWGLNPIPTYTLSVTLVLPDAYEGDNTAAQASTIATDGTPQDHSIHLGTDVDWAKFTLLGSSNVVIETSDTSGDTMLWLYGPDSSTTLIQFDNDGGNNLFSRVQRDLGPGTYYVRVAENGADDVIPDYTLTVTATPLLPPDALEPDDTPAQAAPIATDGTPQNRSIHFEPDVDWATFTLAQPSEVVIATNGPAGDTEMWLFGPNDPTLLLAYDNDGGPGAFSLIERLGGNALAAGTYYVQVREFGQDDLIPAYTLAVTATPTAVTSAAVRRDEGFDGFPAVPLRDRAYAVEVQGIGLARLEITTPWGAEFDSATYLGPSWNGLPAQFQVAGFAFSADLSGGQNVFRVEWWGLGGGQWADIETGTTQLDVTRVGGTWMATVDFAGLPVPVAPHLTTALHGDANVPLSPTFQWDAWTPAPGALGAGIGVEVVLADTGNQVAAAQLASAATQWPVPAPLNAATSYGLALDFHHEAAGLVNGVNVARGSYTTQAVLFHTGVPPVDIALTDPAPGTQVLIGSQYAIQWADGDPASGEVELYWDADADPSNNTAANEGTAWGVITTGIPASDSANSFNWVVDLPTGNWYLYAVLDDGAADRDYTAVPISAVGIQLVASQNFGNGLIISFYDVNPLNGLDVPNVTWSPAAPGATTDVHVVTRGRSVDSITLLARGAGIRDLGILIEGNDRLGTLLDSRLNPNVPLGFLASTGPISSVNLRSGIAGGYLGRLVTPGGITLPADLDGDGNAGDRTGLATFATLGSATIRGDVDGDVLADQGLTLLAITGGNLNGDAATWGALGTVQVTALWNAGTASYVGGGIAGSVRGAAGVRQVSLLGGNFTGGAWSDGAIQSILVRGLVAPGGARWGGGLNASIRSGGPITVVQADSMTGALLSSATQIGQVLIQGNADASFVLAGYDVGADRRLATEDDNPLTGGRVHSGNITAFTVNGNIANTVVAAGVGPGLDGNYLGLADNDVAPGESRVAAATVRGAVGPNVIILADTDVTRWTNTLPTWVYDTGGPVPAILNWFSAAAGLPTRRILDADGDTLLITLSGAGRGSFDPATGQLILQDTRNSTLSLSVVRGAAPANGVYDGPAIVILGGDDDSLASLTLGAGITLGDVTLDGAVGSATIQRIRDGSTLTLDGGVRSLTSNDPDGVADLVLRSRGGAIGTLTAMSGLTAAGGAPMLLADSFTTLIVRGALQADVIARIAGINSLQVLGTATDVAIAANGTLGAATITGALTRSAITATELRSLSIGGAAIESRIGVTGLLSSATFGGNFTNSTIQAGSLASVIVRGLITEDPIDGDTDVIHAAMGRFLAREGVGASWTIDLANPHWFDGVLCSVG